MPVSSATSKFACQSARRDARSDSSPSKRTKLAVEVAGRLQQPVAHVLELVLLEQEVFADAGVKRLDRLDRQIVPGLRRRPASGSARRWLGQCRFALSRGQRPATRPWPGSARPAPRQPDHPGHQGHGRGRHRRAVPPRPSPRPACQRLAPGRDRLVGHPAIEVVGQRPAARHSGRRAGGHGLQADRLQRRVDARVELRGRRKSPRCTARITSPIVALERRPAGQQAVERRAQAIDVRPRAQPIEFAPRPAPGSCRPACPAHCPGSVSDEPLAEEGTSVRSPPDARLDSARRLGQAPVDHQCLAVFADDDVARLDVAVQHAAAVRIVDGVADVDEPPQQLAQLQRPAAGIVLCSDSSAWNRSIASLRLSPLMNRIA